MSTNVVDDLLEGITHGDLDVGVWDPEARLDATVPNWRFAVHGGPAIRNQLAGWYPAPGRFEELHRRPLPDGELVEFLLCWEMEGEQYACHQAHALTVRDGRVTIHEVWCGGPWDTELQTQMADAAAGT